MPTPKTYSFLDTQASIQGPGGAFSIGAGAGIAEEGITVEPNVDQDTMTIGADGTGMHSLIADQSGKITVSADSGAASLTSTRSGSPMRDDPTGSRWMVSSTLGCPFVASLAAR